MKVLVAGVPRSGSTWVGTVLGATPGASFVNEPDDPRLHPYAGRALRGLSFSPILRVGDDAPAAYVRLWDAAFDGRVRYVRGQERAARALFDGLPDPVKVGSDPARRVQLARLRMAQALAVPRHADPGAAHRVVKSVQATLALDWIRDGWDPRVVLCFRHPLDIVASRIMVHGPAMPASRAWREYALDEFGVGSPARDDGVTWTAWAVGVMTSALERARERDRSLVVASHERLCENPVLELRAVVERVGLQWSPRVEQVVVELNRPGTGYEITRVAADQPGKWRTLLTTEQAERAREALAPFPIGERYELD